MFVPIIGGIWLLVELGFLRGTEGANRFRTRPDSRIELSNISCKQCPVARPGMFVFRRASLRHSWHLPQEGRGGKLIAPLSMKVWYHLQNLLGELSARPPPHPFPTTRGPWKLHAHEKHTLTTPLPCCRPLCAAPRSRRMKQAHSTTVQSWLDAAGFKSERLIFTDANTPDIDNLFSRIGNSSPHLCALRATLTWCPRAMNQSGPMRHFAAEIRDGVMYGRGTTDMKGSVAAFAAAASDFVRENPRFKGSISFLITNDEEGPAINGTVKVLQWMKDHGHIAGPLPRRRTQLHRHAGRHHQDWSSRFALGHGDGRRQSKAMRPIRTRPTTRSRNSHALWSA